MYTLVEPMWKCENVQQMTSITGWQVGRVMREKKKGFFLDCHAQGAVSTSPEESCRHSKKGTFRQFWTYLEGPSQKKTEERQTK